MLNAHFYSKIEEFSTNILLSLMYFFDSSKINSNIKKVYEKFEDLIISKPISMVSGKEKRFKLMKEVIIERISSQLTGGIFKNKRKLPSNEFLNLLKKN